MLLNTVVARLDIVATIFFIPQVCGIYSIEKQMVKLEDSDPFAG